MAIKLTPTNTNTKTKTKTKTTTTMQNLHDRFDAEPDWQAYGQPAPGDPNDAWSDSSSSHDGSNPDSNAQSWRSNSPAPSSVPGNYAPPHRRRREYGVLQEEGKVGYVSRRGNLKTLGAPWDKEGSFRKVQVVPFALKPVELAYMQKNFPNTFFSVSKDHNHDHPIAHLETMIATRQAIDTIPDDSRILDVYGNPRARDSFMNRRDLRGRTMETVVSLATEKDYLRQATKWGPLYDQNGNVRYHNMDVNDLVDPANADWIRAYDVLLFIHTGYYIPMDMVARILHLGERTVAKFIIHRHKDEQGKLFNGECEYVNRNEVVVQRNVATGERYVHASLEWMFRSVTKVWRTPFGAVAWTFKKVTDETWIIDIAACPNDLDERFGAYHREANDLNYACKRMNEESLMDIQHTYRLPHVSGASVKTVGGVVCLYPDGMRVPLQLTNMAYYEYLTSSMIGKPRDKASLQDLFALARRENALTSTFPGSKRFDVPPDQVADHVVAAFLSGVERETELLAVLRSADEAVAVMDKLRSERAFDVHTNRGMVRTALKVTKELNEVRRAKDTFTAILDTIDRVA
jgi:hypothetical protein